MNDVDAHVTRARDADQGIHVCAVHVNQTTGIMHDATNLFDVSLEQAERVGICQHQPGHVSVRAQLSQVIEIGQSFVCRPDRFDGESRKMR